MQSNRMQGGMPSGMQGMQGGMGMGGAQWSKGGVSGMPGAQYLGCSFGMVEIHLAWV